MATRFEEHSGPAVTWIDVQEATQREMDRLADRWRFSALELEDCLNTRQQRNKVERQPDHLFIILRFPLEGTQAHSRLRSQVAIFLGQDYLVTVHQGELRPLADIWETATKSPELLGKPPGFLLYRIVDGLVDSLFPLLDKLGEELDELEESVFDERVEAIRAITSLRRWNHYLRASVAPLKRTVADLSTEIWGTDRTLLAHWKDVNDHIAKVWDKLEETRETIEIFKDTDLVLSTAKTNKILAILTIAFTLAIPATVVGTFYGMNVNLPGGLETGSWTFLGPYTTAIVVVVLSVFFPGIWMLWYFRRLGWV